jgi:hypothetical protein
LKDFMLCPIFCDRSSGPGEKVAGLLDRLHHAGIISI